MPRIEFSKNIAPIEVAAGTNLMTALTGAHLPVTSSCYGKGVCSKCRVQIINGQENLSLETASEVALRQRNNISNDYRISCQTQVLGDVTVDTSYW